MAGLLDISPEAQQGLLGLGAGLLRGSSGHYGQFGPALGMGMQGFNQNYFGAVQQKTENEDRAKRLMLLEKMQNSQIAENDSQAALRKQQMDIAAQQQAARARILGGFGQQQPAPMGAPQTPQGLGGFQGGTMLPRAAAGAESDLLASPIRQPAANAPLQTPNVDVNGQTPPLLQNKDALRALAAQLQAANLHQDATFYSGLADKLESQENTENTKKGETYTDNQGIVRYKTGPNVGMPLPNQEPKLDFEEIFDPTSPSQTRLVPKSEAAGKPGSAKIKATQVTQTMGGGPNLTPGQKKVDEKYADDYVEWNASGGYADVVKQLEQLREVSKRLEKGGLTGPITGSVPGAIQQFTNPEAIAAKEAVQEVAQRNLRIVLGAQFTAKEGENLIERVYNPRLDEKENKKRVDRLITQIQKAAESKQDAANYFEKNGTLMGWKGKKYTLSDFDPDAPEPKAPTKSGPMRGQIVDGYKFKGGDPSLESSWEKQ